MSNISAKYFWPLIAVMIHIIVLIVYANEDLIYSNILFILYGGVLLFVSVSYAGKSTMSPIMFVCALFLFYTYLPMFDRLVLVQLIENSEHLKYMEIPYLYMNKEDDVIFSHSIIYTAINFIIVILSYKHFIRKQFSPRIVFRSENPLFLVYVYSVIIFLLITILYVGNVGDIVNVKWNSRSDLITHIFELIKLMSIISIVGAIFAFVEKPGFNRLVLIILLVISLMAVLTLGGSRRHLIWILLISLFLIHYFIRRISVIHVLLLFVLMLLVVIAGDILRSSGFTMSALLVRPEASDLLRGNTEYNAAHGILMELFARKNEMVFLNGQSIVKPILAIIPREIYPSKPIPITQLMAELIYPNQVGHSVGASFFGEMYFNFSYFGALASFFYGWLVSYVSRRLEYMMNLYHTKTKRITIELLFFVILYLSLFNFFRGPFADSFYFIIAFILILSPYLKIIVRRRN